TSYFRALPIIYRAKKQAEAAPGVGADSDYHFINRFGASPVPDQLIEVIAAHYAEEEKRRENDIVIIEGKLADEARALAAKLNLLPETEGVASEQAVSEGPSQTGRIPQPAAPSDGKPA